MGDRDTTKYTLFTNISFVQPNGSTPMVRFHANAILLEDGGESFMGVPPYRIRGFGPDAAWPVFTYWLTQPIKYSVTAAQDNSKQMLSKGKLTPIFGGSILGIENGPSFFLQSDNAKHPLDIFEQTGDIENVWEQLEHRTVKYFQTPYVAHSSYGPNPNKRNSNATRHPR